MCGGDNGLIQVEMGILPQEWLMWPCPYIAPCTGVRGEGGPGLLAKGSGSHPRPQEFLGPQAQANLCPVDAGLNPGPREPLGPKLKHKPEGFH